MSPQLHPRLSLALIVRDAAEPLTETLESIRGLADEIIVVDTGSRDATRQVAERFGAKVFPATWQDDFSALRNHAVQLCTGDWVLVLDAGERFTPSDASGLRSFVQSHDPAAAAYLLVVRIPPKTGEIAAEQFAAVRLFPNDPALRYSGRVRESLLPSIESLGWQLEGLPFRIHRGLRDLDPVRTRERAERNLRLAQLQLRDQPDQVHLWNCVGDACHALGKQPEAAQAYRCAIELAPPASSDMLAAYYGLLGALEGTADAKAAQLAVCLAALEVFPLDAQLLCAAGGYMQSQGQLDLAIRSYETAARYGQVHPLVCHLEGMIEIARSCYAQALLAANRPQEAEQTLQQAVSDFPDGVRLRRQLLSLCVRQGKRKEALAQVDLLPPETPYREALVSAVRGGCLASAGHWVPARAYLEAAYRGGCRDVVCFEWLAKAALALSEWDTARQAAQQWLAAEPQHPDLPAVLQALAAAPQTAARRHLPAPLSPPLGISTSSVASAM